MSTKTKNQAAPVAVGNLEILVTGEDIERLRLSKCQDDGVGFGFGMAQAGKSYFKGFKRGAHWAAKEATYKQLRRLQAFIEELRDDPDRGWPQWLRSNGTNGYAYAKHLAYKVNAKKEDNGIVQKMFGHDAYDLINDVEASKGFVEGALVVWLHVKAKL
jgi:hypothetical protein